MDLKIRIYDENLKRMDEICVYQDGSDSEGAAQIRAFIEQNFTVEKPEEVVRTKFDYSLETYNRMLREQHEIRIMPVSYENAEPVYFNMINDRGDEDGDVSLITEGDASDMIERAYQILKEHGETFYLDEEEERTKELLRL